MYRKIPLNKKHQLQCVFLAPGGAGGRRVEFGGEGAGGGDKFGRHVIILESSHELFGGGGAPKRGRGRES